MLCDDGLVHLDKDGVTLRHYYFPTAKAKRIPYSRIRRIELRPMGWCTGKGRLWGTASPSYWLPLDLGRIHKSQLVVLELDGRIKPSFTPEDPEKVVALIRQLIDQA